MKMIILKILGAILVLMAMLLIAALFVKKRYTIVREVRIDRPPQRVYDHVRFHKNQPEFNHWLSLDTNTIIEIKGKPDGEVGSIMYFESQNSKVGTGIWEHTDLIDGERIGLEIRFLKPYKFTAVADLHFKPISNNNGTLLVWEYKSGMDWPMNITLLFLDMDKIIGKDIEATLNKIKINLEK